MKKITSLLLIITMIMVSVAATSLTVAADDTPVIKNVIYMIPDGGGFALFDVANGVKEAGGFNEGLYPNSTKVTASPMFMKDYLVGTETTYSASSSITDSAAGGTALSSGYKTNNKHVGVDPNGVPHATILEASQLAGKRTGICTTYEWTNATPAAFTAHNISRENYKIMSEQIVNQGLDVVLGVGFGAAKWGSVKEAEDRGYTVVNTKTQLRNIQQGTKVWGNLSNTAFPSDINLSSSQPTLAEMTDAAIRALEGDEDGFFLMVEGSSVDGGGHNNNILQAVSEYLSFDAAFKVAVEYAKGRNDTIVIAAPDHDTGGLVLPNADKVGGNTNSSDYATAVAEIQAGKNSKSGISWTTTGHTSRNCGVWFYAPAGINPPEGLSLIPGDNLDKRENEAYVINNIEIAPYLAELTELDLQAATEELFVDVTDLGSYNTENSTFTFNKFSFDDTDVSIKANQSVATVDGKVKDLNGEIAVYSNDKFYVPKSVLALRKKPDLDTREARYLDGLTGKVLVKGQVEEIAKTDKVTMLLVKKGAENMSKNDIGYVAQTTLNDDGGYSFDFLFNGNIDEYELRLMLDGKVVTDSVTLAKADYLWTDTAVKVYQEDENSVSGEVLINNYAGVEGLTYQIGLLFYDKDNKVIGVSVSRTNTIENGVTTFDHRAEIPAGTVNVKAVAWSDITRMIPLSNYDLATKK